jgi:hypothetical protein
MELRYITRDDIPLVGPDPYRRSEKIRAGEAAEQKLEADVNDGREYDPSEISRLHKQAVAAWATYVLAAGPVAPDDARSGDFYTGSGDDQAEYASQMKTLYESNIASIEASEADTSSDSSDIILSG